MGEPAVALGETAPPCGHVVQCWCCSACCRPCTQTLETYSSLSVFRRASRRVSVVHDGSLADRRNTVMQEFSTLLRSRPSHQQELSSAFSLTVLRDAPPGGGEVGGQPLPSCLSCTHYKWTHTNFLSLYVTLKILLWVLRRLTTHVCSVSLRQPIL